MLVHIVLSDYVRDDPAARWAVLKEITATTGDLSYNKGRFERYGIITAEVKPALLPLVRKIEGVQDVKADELKIASG